MKITVVSGITAIMLSVLSGLEAQSDNISLGIAGVSVMPHVMADSMSWGAPLEMIGDMCRSLRELNSPMPCPIWSQGPHEGWERYGGRKTHIAESALQFDPAQNDEDFHQLVQLNESIK